MPLHKKVFDLETGIKRMKVASTGFLKFENARVSEVLKKHGFHLVHVFGYN